MAEDALDGKVAIITGAGGGMGGAMTLGFVRSGARVAAIDIRREGLDAVAAEAERARGAGRVIPLVGDVTRPEECAQVVEQTIEAFGAVHILVNNAGVGMQTIKEDYMNAPVRFWEADIDRWQRMLDVNYKGPYLLARAVAPHMVAQGWGRIINVTTSLNTMMRAAYTPYGQSKAALEAGSSSWAKDLKDTGVTVNVLVPGGPTNTGFIPASAPFDRAKLVQPEVMVAPACWLASVASDGVTDCRFVGVDWDPNISPTDAAEKARAPAAWPNAGTQAVWPD